MDNQQPSPVFIINLILINLIINIGCRSQTKMAVGNLISSYELNCLRYSRADYLRKLVRPLKHKLI